MYKHQIFSVNIEFNTSTNICLFSSADPQNSDLLARSLQYAAHLLPISQTAGGEILPQ